MHELSLAIEVIDLANKEAERHNALSVSEISIEVGNLSGVEADAFESALSLIKEGTILDKADLKIIRKNGKGICSQCNLEFEMRHRIDFCPVCRSFPAEIIGGNEFRVTSMVIED
jgi:hydrogenase nickel incorporation protein HypA/HybF